MSKPRETSTDPDNAGIVDPFDTDLPKKPNWVNLAQLETPVDDALVNNLLYKPALRYHGLTSGLWGLGLSRTPSIVTDSKPPSYKFSDPLKSKHNIDTLSTSDQGSMYRTENLSAMPPVTLRRRNTIAVILVAIGLLAMVATITGIVLHAMQPNDLLRAHVRFTIANENYTDIMLNKSSEEFTTISRTLCSEMDFYYLTSELSDFYLGCRLISIRNDSTKPGLAVHYTIDFKDNPTTNDKDRIKNVILRKSGRQASDANLYFVIRKYLVYLRSLRVDLEKVPVPSNTPNYSRPTIPWRDDIDFIARKSLDQFSDYRSTNPLTDAYTNTPTFDIGGESVLRRILPVAKDVLIPMLDYTALYVKNNNTNIVGVNRFTNYENLTTITEHFFNNEPIDITSTDSSEIQDQILLNQTRVNMNIMDINTASQHANYDNIRSLDRRIDNPKIYDIQKDTNSPLDRNILDSIFALSSLSKSETTNVVLEGTKEDGARLRSRPNHHHNLNPYDHKQEEEIFLLPGVNALQSSFSQSFKMLPQISTSTLHHTDLNTRNKVMTISKNMFLINGQSTKNYIDKLMIAPTPSLSQSHISFTSVELFSHHDVLEESKTTAFLSEAAFIGNEVAITQRLQEEIDPSPHIKYVINQTLTPSLLSQYLTNKVVDKDFSSVDVFLNELVVSDPQRTSIVIQQPKIEWINIFNVPRRRVAINVEDVMKKIEPRTNTGPFVNRLNTQEDSFSFAIRDLIPEFKHTFPQFNVNRQNNSTKRPKVKDNNLNGRNVLTNRINHSMDIVIPEKNSHTHADDNHHGPFPHHDHAGTKNHKIDDNHGPKHSSVEIEKHFREFADLNELEQSIFELNTDRKSNYPQFGRLEDHHPNFHQHLEQERDNEDQITNMGEREQSQLIIDAMNEEEEETTGDEIDATNTNKRHITDTASKIGRMIFRNGHADLSLGGIRGQSIANNNLVLKTNSHIHFDRRVSQRHNQINPSIPQPIPEEQLNFGSNKMNQFVGRQTFIRENMLDKRQRLDHEPQDQTSRNTGIRTPTHLTTRRLRLSFLENDILSRNEDQKPEETDAMPTGWLALAEDSRRSLPFRDYLHRAVRPTRFQSHVHERQKMHLFGIPISSDFNDIDDIKGILRDVIDSLFNMTKKIDSMQNAIDFINNQLHEERGPIFRLGHTLKNMTTSLDNLKLNLKNINTTLDGFKTYLKQFNNTIFDVQDVLKYLDETFDNLEKTALFVGNSLKDMDDSVDLVNDVVIGGNSSLKHLNNSAYGVKETTNFANKTLDSMGKTLESLENAVSGLNIMVDDVLIGMTGMNISLRNINGSVQNSLKKMEHLKEKMNLMNFSVNSIEETVARLNKTYSDINDALSQLNETFVFINGTAKDAIHQLQHTDEKLTNISQNMLRMRNGMASMNASLKETIKWMGNMIKTLDKFNTSVDRHNDTISVNLKNSGVIEALSALLRMNQTLLKFGHNVDHINKKLDNMETNLLGLETNLDHLQNTLKNLNVTFREINKSIETSNRTIGFIKQSLGLMNSSFDVINETLSDLTDEFGNIKQTLDSVNSTLLLIQENGNRVENSSLGISSTLLKMNDKIDELSIQTKKVKLNMNMNISNKSLPDLRIHLQNTNTSLEKVKNQTKSIKKSYKLLVKTIDSLELSVENLLTSVNESDDSLQRVNKSLMNIEESIENMEDSKKDLNELLEKLKESSRIMKDTTQDLGFAFPNLATNIKDLNTYISQLEKQIIKQSIAIKNQNYTKESNYQHLRNLKELKYLIHHGLVDTVNLIKSIKQQSEDTGSKIVDLDGIVIGLSSQFDNLVRNVKHFNNFLPPTQELYNKVLNDITDNILILNNLSNVFANHTTVLKRMENASNKFINFIAPYKDINQTITFSMLTIKEKLRHLQSLKEILNEQASKIWNDIGGPVGINQPHSLVQKELKQLNAEMNATKNDLVQKSDDINNLFSSSNDTEKNFRNIYMMLENMNVFENVSAQSKNSLKDLEDDLNRKNNKSMTTDKYIEKLTNYLRDLEFQYGNINGTSNDTRQDYYDIEHLLFEASKDLNDFDNNLGNLKNELKTLENKLDNKISNYTRDKFDGSTTSKDKIKQMISDIAGYHDRMADMNMLIKQSSLNKTNVSLNNVDRMLKILEGNLKNKRDKHNLLRKIKPLVAGQFSTIDVELTGANTSIQNLQERVSKLLNHADILSKRSEIIPNMNITPHKEYIILNGVDKNLMNQQKQVFSLNNLIKSAKERFQNILKNNLTYADVNTEVKALKKELQSLNNSEALLNINIKEMVDHLDFVSTILQNIERVLDMYDKAFENTEDLNSDLDYIKNKSQTTDKLLKGIQVAVAEIDNTYLNLRNNYTNFTDTNVDLNGQFLADTLSEVKNTVSNLIDQWLSITNDTSLVAENFIFMRNVMNNTEFNRTNMESIIAGYVTNETKKIRDDIEHLNVSLDNVNEEIKMLNTQIAKLDEIVYLTNNQLRLDKQKKIIAELNLPRLERKQRRIDDLLMKIDSHFLNVTRYINGTIRDYDYVVNRLEDNANLNISTGDFTTYLSNFTNAMAIIQSQIQSLPPELSNINLHLMKDQGGYLINDTIGSMKNRFKNVSDKMDLIIDVIDNVKKELAKTAQEAKMIKGNITSLNATLNDYDEGDKTSMEFQLDFLQLKQRSNKANSDHTQLNCMIRNLTSDINSLSTRFDQVNGSLLNNLIGDLLDKLSKSETGYKNISSYIKSTKKNIIELENKLREENESKSMILIDKSKLDEFNLLRIKGLNEARSVLNDTNSLFDIFDNESGLLTESINELLVDVKNVDLILKRQEKKDLYTLFAAEDRFLNANITLQNITNLMEVLKENISRVIDYSDQVESFYDRVNNLNISFNQKATVLDNANKTLYQSSSMLESIIDKFDSLQVFLDTKDGKPFSDAESVFEMRERYKELDIGLKNILASSENISDSFYVISENVQKEMRNLLDTNQVLEKYRNVTDKLNSIAELMSILKKGVHLKKIENVNRKQKYHKLIDQFLVLQKEFDSMNDSNAIELLRLVDSEMQLGGDNFVSITRKLKEIQKSTGHINDTINHFSDMSNQTFSIVDDIDTFVNDFNNISSKLESDINSVNDDLLFFTNESVSLDKNLDLIQRMIVNLTDMLTQNKKEALIDKMSDKIMQKYYTIIPRLGNTSILLNDIKEEVNGTLGTILELEKIMSNISSVNISLELEKGATNADNGSIYKSIDELHVTRYITEAIREQVENMKSDKFIRKNTIDVLEKIFFDMMNSIGNVSMNVTNILDVLANTNASIEKTKDKLSSFEGSLLLRKELALREGESRKRFDHNTEQQNDITKYRNVNQDLITEINNTLLSIKNRYNAIHDPDIWERYDKHNLYLGEKLNELFETENIDRSTNLTLSKNKFVIDKVSAHIDQPILNVTSLEKGNSKLLSDFNELDILQENISIALSQDYAFQDNLYRQLTDLKINLENTEKELNNRRIIDFMKTQFPRVLDRFNFVNKTFKAVENMLTGVQEFDQRLKQKMNETDYLLKNHPFINISLSNQRNISRAVSKALSKAFVERDIIAGELNNISDIISNRIATNDTINLIGDRLGDYIENLDTILLDINTWNTSIGKISLNSSDALSSLNNIDIQLGEFKDLEKKRSSINDDLIIIKEQFSDIQMKRATHEDKYDTMQKTFFELSDSISNANETELLNELETVTNAVNELDLMIRGSNVEFLNFDRSLTDNFARLNFTDTLTRQSITELNNLTFTTDKLKNILFDTEQEMTNKLKVNLSTLTKASKSEAELLSLTNSKINRLQNMFLNEEKEKYLNNILPEILNSHKQLHERISIIAEDLGQTENKINFLNSSLDKLLNRIQNTENIQFNLSNLRDDIDGIEYDMKYFSTAFDEQKDLFYGIDGSVFRRSFWKNNETNRIKHVMDNIKSKIANINANMTEINRTNADILDDIVINGINISNISDLIDNYEKVNENNDLQYDSLKKYDEMLNKTNDRVEKLSSSFRKQKSTLIRLNETITNSNNNTISRLMKDIEQILIDKVGLRLPLLRNIVQKRIFENLEKARSLQEYSSLLLKKNHKNPDGLDKVITEIKKNIEQVATKMKVMNTSNVSFNQELNKLESHLDESNQLLESLEYFITSELKRRFINNVVPDMSKSFDDLNKFVNNVAQMIPTLEESANKTETDLTFVIRAAENFDNINISLDSLINGINESVTDLHYVKNNFPVMFESLRSLTPEQLNSTDLINNVSITLSDLRKVAESLRNNLSEFENSTMITLDDLIQINKSTTYFAYDIDFLRENILTFGNLREKQIYINADIEKIESYSINISKGLKNTRDELLSLNHTIQALYDKYNNTDQVNGKLSEILAQTTNKVLNFEQNFRDALNNKSEILESLRGINNTLDTQINTTSLLNSTILFGEQMIPQTEQKTSQLLQSMKRIYSGVPTINKSIDDLRNFIKYANHTLKTEDRKRNYVNRIQPKLHARYKDINATFDMTNRSLQIIQDNIRQLEGNIQRVKENMGTHKTIDIDMSAIEANVSEMENSLEIMKGHYNNVEEVVGMLKNDLKKYRHPINNLTLNETMSIYTDFNKSLDNVDKVLRKIDTDITDIDDHFMFINDTVFKIDEAIKKFDTERDNNENAHKELESIESSLNVTKADINDISSIYTSLNNSFMVMQSTYKDVLNTTAQNNSQFLRNITDVRTDLDALKKTTDKLFVEMSIAKENFQNMNQSLFRPVRTYDGLNDTLAEFGSYFNNLTTFVHTLSDDINMAKSKPVELNSSLADLGDVLQKINKSLHDEQAKYNFLTSNLGGLQSKSNHIASKLDDTFSSITSAHKMIIDANKTIETLKKHLNDNAHLNISIENETYTMYNSAERIKDIKDSIDKVKNEFNKLMSNVSITEDRSGTISEIKQRYSNFNSSLDSLLEKLNMMDKVLGDTTNKTIRAKGISNDIWKSVRNYEEISLNVSKSVSNMDLLKNNLSKPMNNIIENENSLQTLEEQAKNIFATYVDVIDQDLRTNLTSLLRELSNEKQKLSALRNRHFENQDRHYNASKSIGSIENLLNGTFYSKDQLDKATNFSTEGLVLFQQLPLDLVSENNALEEDLDIVKLRISKIESQLNDLNETFFEEKTKIEFVKNNFPSAEARFKMLDKSLKESNAALDDKSNELDNTRKKLIDLKTAFNSIPSVELALHKENTKSNEVVKDVFDLRKILNNITEQFETIDISQLKDMQRPLSNLKGDYDIYNNAAESLENYIGTLERRLRNLNEKLLALNMTTLDISSSLHTFKGVNRNASTIFNDFLKLNDSFGGINNSILNMEIKLTQHNETLMNIITNFTEIKNPLILKKKESLEKMVLKAYKELSKLKESAEHINDVNVKAGDKSKSLNSTLSKKKSTLSDVKTDVANANALLNNISSLLDIHNISQNTANVSIKSLQPHMQSISDEIDKLYRSFESEQRKLDYVKQEVPILKTSFRNLKLPLENTNKRLAKTEMKLSDLKLKIDSVGTRLKRFKPILITTIIEDDSWQNVSKIMKGKSYEFIELSKLYNNLTKDISQIGNTNDSVETLKNKYNTINKTIDKITQGLSLIHGNLSEIDNRSGSIYDVLERIGNIMDNFKLVQVKTRSLKKKLELSAKDVAAVNNKSTTAKKNVLLIKGLLRNMELKFKEISNERWRRMLPVLKKNISKIDSGLMRTNTAIKELHLSVNDSRYLVDGALNLLQSSGLKRDNASHAIESVNKTATTTSEKLDNVTKETSRAKKSLSVLNDEIEMAKKVLENLNKSLTEELRKSRFVNVTLPDLRVKHTRVNASFSATVPDVQILQGQIDDVVSVISKIKEKMKVFGLQDTDQTILKWDQSIERLNKTVMDIKKKNRLTLTKLKELKQKLWKVGPMYTKTETFQEVKDRFSGYNNSLNEIMAAVHKIEVKLVDLDRTSQDLTATLVDHEEMLTTTPEPLGPPLWLQFTSTTVGTIGKDPGVAECAVGDLTDWEIMKITRKRKGRKEETVAAWKFGVGARKTIRERRMSVKKSENATGGSLKINIRSLQCEDEAAYYCSIDTYRKYPLRTDIAVITPPEDSLDPDFPTEVFEDKNANFSCTGHPGYPSGRLIWKIKHQNEKEFKDYNFYSAKTQVSDTDCIRTEVNRVEHQFDMSWNNTKIRCYIENTQYYGEGIIRLLPYDICNKVRFLGTISHPYTPHKYIVCGKELNIMQCPGNTCYDKREENCVQCAASQQSADPCHGKPLYSYVAHERDCKKYYICMGPTKTVKKCTKGYFNPNRPGNCVMSYPESYCAQRSG